MLTVVHQRSHFFFPSIHPCIFPLLSNHLCILPTIHPPVHLFCCSLRRDSFPKGFACRLEAPTAPGHCRRITQMQTYQRALCTLEPKLQMAPEGIFKIVVKYKTRPFGFGFCLLVCLFVVFRKKEKKRLFFFTYLSNKIFFWNIPTLFLFDSVLAR